MAKLLRTTKEEFGHYMLIYGLPIIVFFFLFLLSKSQVFYSNPELFSPAIILDLIVTIPLVMLIVLHKKKISKIYAAPLILIGALIAGKIIPIEFQGPLNLIKFTLIPIIEVTVVFFVIRKVYKTIGQLKTTNDKHSDLDFYDGLNLSLKEVFPKRAASLAINEIATIYYLLFTWKTHVLRENEYSYHKKGGGGTISYVLLGLVAVETFVAHVLLLKWNGTVAWVMTILSVYTMVQIVGMIKGAGYRPILIRDNILYLRYSFLNEVSISIDDIIDVEETRRSLNTREDTIMLSALGELETQNIVIHLNRTYTLNRIYGLTSSFKSIGVFVDEKEKFLNDLSSRRSKK